MNFFRQCLLIVSVLFVALMLFGLYKPALMLWWSDVQTRRMIIKLYGGIAVLTYLVYLVTIFLRQ